MGCELICIFIKFDYVFILLFKIYEVNWFEYCWIYLFVFGEKGYVGFVIYYCYLVGNWVFNFELMD